jgi:hypothetical protein
MILVKIRPLYHSLILLINIFDQNATVCFFRLPPKYCVLKRVPKERKNKNINMLTKKTRTISLDTPHMIYHWKKELKGNP